MDVAAFDEMSIRSVDLQAFYVGLEIEWVNVVAWVSIWSGWLLVWLLVWLLICSNKLSGWSVHSCRWSVSFLAGGVGLGVFC